MLFLLRMKVYIDYSVHTVMVINSKRFGRLGEKVTSHEPLFALVLVAVQESTLYRAIIKKRKITPKLCSKSLGGKQTTPCKISELLVQDRN